MPRHDDDEDDIFPGVDDPYDDEDEDPEGDEDGDPFLPFDPEDMEAFYDWEADFPELDWFDDLPDLDDSDWYE